MYKLKVKSLEEFVCIQRQIDFLTGRKYIIDFNATLVTRKFVMGKKVISPAICGDYSIDVNKDKNRVQYSLADGFDKHEDFKHFIRNNMILETPLAFIEEIEDIMITNITDSNGDVLHIDCLENREYIDYVEFLQLVSVSRNCNYLDIKFRSNSRIIYAQYFNKRFIRKSTFNNSNKKVSIYVNTIEDFNSMFGDLTLESINFGNNYLDLPELIQCYKDVARKRNYIFKYVIH